MCLTSKWRFPRKAKEDIICYKILISNFDYYFSPYRAELVDIQKEYKAEGESFKWKDGYKKDIGYIHAYTLQHDASRCCIWENSSHHYLRYVVFKCIIPKGTLYRISRNGRECCSKKIKFLEIVND